MLKFIDDKNKLNLTTPTIVVGGGGGHTADCNVYIGKEEPTTNALLWFNPEGEPVEFITEEQVNEKISAIDVTEQLDDYALKTDIPSLDGYAKIEDIPTEPDLSGYALKNEIPSLDGYAKTEDIPATPDLTPYALKTEIPDVSGYLTEDEVIALIEEHGGGGGSLPASEEAEF